MDSLMMKFDFLLQAQISEIKATLYTMTLFLLFPLALITVKLLSQNLLVIQTLVAIVFIIIKFMLLYFSKSEYRRSANYFKMWGELCAEEEYQNAIQK